MSEGSEEQHHHQQQQAQLTSGQSNLNHPPNPLVPIISVTPHSPGLVKHYPVLGKRIEYSNE
jgi:hypothetical protein